MTKLANYIENLEKVSKLTDLGNSIRSLASDACREIIDTGEYGEKWQLDHIIPSCNAKTEEEVYLLNHWSNFQPLCSKLNNEKGCDVNPVSNLELNISIIEDKNIIKNEEIKFAGSIYK